MSLQCTSTEFDCRIQNSAIHADVTRMQATLISTSRRPLSAQTGDNVYLTSRLENLIWIEKKGQPLRNLPLTQPQLRALLETLRKKELNEKDSGDDENYCPELFRTSGNTIESSMINRIEEFYSPRCLKARLLCKPR